MGYLNGLWSKLSNDEIDEDWGLEDPVGMPLEVFEKTADEIGKDSNYCSKLDSTF